MESGQTVVDLSTVVAVIVFCLGLVVGIGGLWLAWRLVRLPAARPPDEADHERVRSTGHDDEPNSDRKG